MAQLQPRKVARQTGPVNSRGEGQTMNSQFDANLSEAALAFNEEAFLYCRGISDTIAQEYARNYARMLLNRAKGAEFSAPRVPYELFGPNRNLIQSTLDRMCEKYFRAK